MTETSTNHPWPEFPYKGLSFYNRNDVVLFSGRDNDVIACARRLAQTGTRVMILQGGTGCGKSSFLRAGLIPFIEKSGFGFEFLKEGEGKGIKSLFVRCTDKPLYKLAETIYEEFLQKPYQIMTPRGERGLDLSSAKLGSGTFDEFGDDVGMRAARLIESLTALAAKLPRTLVLVVDQAEEILTLTQGPAGVLLRKEFFHFMAEFSKLRLDMKLLVAIRTEYFGKFSNEMRNQGTDKDSVADFMLEDLTRDEIIAAIKRPTLEDLPAELVRAAGQPYQHYRFRYEPGLLERIADNLLNAPMAGGILPVLQIVCDRLYRKTREKVREGEYWEIRGADYDPRGLVQDAVMGYVDETIQKLCAEQLGARGDWQVELEVSRWKDLLTQLAHIQYDGTATTTLVRKDKLRESAEKFGCKLAFDKMMDYLSNDNQRIVRPPIKVTDRETREAFECYSLGHDALALALNKWRYVRQKIDSRREALRSGVRGPIRALAIVIAGINILVLAAIVALFSEGWEEAPLEYFMGVGIGLTFLFLGVVQYKFAPRVGNVVVSALLRSRALSKLLGLA